MTTLVNVSTTAALGPNGAAIGLSTTLSLIAALTFLLLLLFKEIAASDPDARSRLASRGMNIGLVPLGIAFVIITTSALLQISP